MSTTAVPAGAKQPLNFLQQGIVSFLQANETWLRPMIVEPQLDRLDWTRGAESLINPTLVYPEYYKQDFHSVEGGYLNKDAALTYDPITAKILVPDEAMLRNETAKAFRADVKTVIDLGCGTGTATRAIAERLPAATVTGIDLSPYMLVAAKHKARYLSNANFLHANAEHLPFDDNSIDAVTASLLFHEMPPDAGLNVMREVMRVLKPGGELIVFDGSQQGLAKLGGHLSSGLFLEPYAAPFLDGNLVEMMIRAGFATASSTPLVFIYELRKGVKA